jgi:hypothetical protein
MKYLNRTCEWCVYYQDAGGECRRKPPVPISNEYGRDNLWPKVAESDWCGEFVDRVKTEESK